MALAFVGQQSLRYGGGPKHGGSEFLYNATYVTEGTLPKGSAWAKNPIPLFRGQAGTPPGDAPGKPWYPIRCNDTARCAGMMDGTDAVTNLEIVDYLRIPSDLPAGEYVLGWRWDCEQSNQIWQ